MKSGLLGYGYASDDEAIESKQPIQKPIIPFSIPPNTIDDWGLESTPYIEEEFEEEEEQGELLKVKVSEDVEIELYDETKLFDENFEDGSEVKYILLPIYKNNSDDDYNYTKLLNAGSKVLMNREKYLEDCAEGLRFFVVDQNSIFGLRLLSFQKYESRFFTCDERVFFETLIIKYKLFGYIPFFYSFAVIFRELGIKKERATSIVKKFKKHGILTSEVITTSLDGRPSQITYFNVDANQLINLIPSIFKQEHQELALEEITKYLKPALRGNPPETDENIDKTNIMQ
jgi:hypothetical protein